MSRFQLRRDKALHLLSKAGAEALLVSSVPNVTYLTGFTGDDSLLLLTKKRALMLSDSRFSVQLEEECPGLECVIRVAGVSMASTVKKAVASSKIGSLAYEPASMTMAQHASFAKEIPQIEWVAAPGLVETLRAVKDRQEIDKIRRAIGQAERSFAVLRAALRADQTEKELADALEHQMRQLGAKGCSFTPIVAVGDRAALPHYRPAGRRVGEGDLLLVDWGADEGLYKSDLTRVLVTGRISPKLERVYGVVLRAQEQAIAQIRPGATSQEIDAIARGIIADAGFGRYFGHGLGHGIGLQIHESPRFAPGDQQRLEAGMVVTVEPGIYLPGWGGVRIEDDVLVTKSGHEVLSHVPKAWELARVEL